MNKKEQNTDQLQIRIQPSLFKKFKKTCEKKYKSVSGALKDLIIKFVEENKK
jgi:hypothetical protein